MLIAGIVIVAAVMGGIFAMTVEIAGFWEAVKGWLFSLGVTCLLMLGVFLIVSSLVP